MVTRTRGEYGDGDEIVEAFCRGEIESAEYGDAVIELLSRFNHGYPVGNLGRLIRCDDEQVMSSGAWLVSELGSKAAEITDEIEFLLEHPARKARYYGIEAVLAAATGHHGRLIAKAVRLVGDPDEAVRRMAMRLLARATPEQLAAAVPYLAEDKMAVLARWLLTSGSDPACAPQIIATLDDSDKTARMFAVAAAARVAQSDHQALEVAAQATDQDVRTFAERELSLPPVRRPRERRQLSVTR